MQDFSPIGSFVIRSSSGTKGQIVPLPSISEDSIEARLILILEQAYSSPLLHKEIHNALHQVLRNGTNFGDKVQLVVRKEETGWRVAFLPVGWNEPVTLGMVTSTEQSPGDSHGYYLQHHSGLLEIMLDQLPKGKSLVVGRDADIPGLAMVSSLSRQHASIKRIDHDTFQVQDLDSKNGTFAYTTNNTDAKNSSHRDYHWNKLETKSKLKGGTLISLGSSSKSFQFYLPESYDHEFVQWKSLVSTLTLLARPGETLSVLYPFKVSRFRRPHPFRIMREVRWSFEIHFSGTDLPLFSRTTQYSETFDRVHNGASIAAYQELRFGDEHGSGFILPGPCLLPVANTLPGKVIALGRENFVQCPKTIEPHHLGLLILDRNNFLVSNKSVSGTVYYRYSTNSWKRMKEIMRLPAGADILLGTPIEGISFTLPRLNIDNSSTSLVRSSVKRSRWLFR